MKTIGAIILILIGLSVPFIGIGINRAYNITITEGEGATYVMGCFFVLVAFLAGEIAILVNEYDK